MKEKLKDRKRDRLKDRKTKTNESGKQTDIREGQMIFLATAVFL